MLIKKPLDFLSAVALFIVVSPLLVIITLLLAASNSGTPFFIQPRVGKGNRIFNVIKFKTMNDQRDSHGALLPDDKRLTGLGRWIRKTSLDELPQLLNILTGDMSFIGPRPLLVEYLPLYSREQVRRHEVKPGITGWAQVNGRNSISWFEKFTYDVWYVDHISFWLDIKIIFITCYKVLRSEGISGRGVATAEKFNGKN